MTKVKIFKKNDIIYGVQIKGHSGYAEEGFDIVCAGVSAVAQMTALGLEKILGLEIDLNTNDGFLNFFLSKEDMSNDKAIFLLNTMEMSLKEISKNYDSYVSMEVKKDVF